MECFTRTLTFDENSKSKTKNAPKSKGKTPIVLDKVEPTKEAAISNIPNFVPSVCQEGCRMDLKSFCISKF